MQAQNRAHVREHLIQNCCSFWVPPPCQPPRALQITQLPSPVLGDGANHCKSHQIPTVTLGALKMTPFGAAVGRALAPWIYCSRAHKQLWDTLVIPSLREPKTELHSELQTGLGYTRSSVSLGPYIVQEARNQERHTGVPRKQRSHNIGDLVNV